jgi:acyl carrier protein phosphodiesterase
MRRFARNKNIVLDLIFDILLLKLFWDYFCENKSFLEFLIKTLRIKSSINPENFVKIQDNFFTM